jgi:hypothetical protein
MDPSYPLDLIEPGDALLYGGRGPFSWLIRVRTFSMFTHVEIAIGNGRAISSRDGEGVGNFPLRVDGLAAILTPLLPVDVNGVIRWYAENRGKPYDWIQLLTFARGGRGQEEKPSDADAYFCSEACREAYQPPYGMFEPFAPDVASKAVWPGAFWYSPMFGRKWVRP